MLLPYQSFKQVILKWSDPFLRLNEEHFTFHLQYKHLVRLLTVTWRTFLPQKSESVRTHSSNSIEMQPHYSQPSRENATPSSSTTPLASYKEVAPPAGSASLRYRNRGGISILMCEQIEALSGMVFVPAQNLSGKVWTQPKSPKTHLVLEASYFPSYK